jgi:imidazolonepropionase-like amidohydrolase
LILENCLVRTMDPQVPTQRALAIAGDRIAGGVGVHETALASPDAVDVGGRVVLPGFTDAQCTSPPELSRPASNSADARSMRPRADPGEADSAAASSSAATVAER